MKKQRLGILPLLLRNVEATIGLVIVAIYIGVGLAAAISGLLRFQITPYDPLQQNTGVSLGAPSISHYFGTDFLGCDVFSRVVASIPNGLVASFCVVAVAITVGALIGAVAAFKGGLFDELLMRFTDVIFALPALVIAMVIAVALGPGLTHMMIALMVIWWPPYARVARRSLEDITTKLHRGCEIRRAKDSYNPLKACSSQHFNNNAGLRNP